MPEPPWPPITEPELLDRLALDDVGFHAFMRGVASAVGRRPYDDAALEHALGYPWRRPARSYLLREEQVTVLDDLAPAARARTIAAFFEDRHPLVAYGANASPASLAAKLAHFPDAEDRTALVLTGLLHDLDVGPSATVALYGSMPATLVPSPGTAVRVAVQLVTADQATQLTWSELSYRLGRLEQATFTPDDAGVEVAGLFAYASRFGAWRPGGEALALAALPARGRTAAARTQRELLDRVAPLVLGDPRARAEQLVRAVFDDMGAVAARLAAAVWPDGELLAPGHFTPLPRAPAPR